MSEALFDEWYNSEYPSEVEWGETPNRRRARRAFLAAINLHGYSKTSETQKATLDEVWKLAIKHVYGIAPDDEAIDCDFFDELDKLETKTQ